jgi:hypothetical protein
MTVSLVARRYGVAPEPALHVALAGGPGALTAGRQRRRGRAGVDYRTLQSQVRGLLGKRRH